MRFWKRFIRFAVALVNDRGFEYEAGGKAISCPQCGNTRFHKSRAQLNTKDMTLWQLDYFDKSARMLHCKKCGSIRWFGKSLVNRTLSKEKP
jgi:DNA-directed RNA polymerase subunit RPC12/RpoP